jgi:cytochrome b subunit of formate dehydrogenase
MKKNETNKFDNCPCMDKQNEDKSSVKQGMMKCMKGARWFLLVPGIFITIAFLLGYFLDPVTIRVLWLIVTGILLILGITFYILMNFWISGMHKKSRVCSI